MSDLRPQVWLQFDPLTWIAEGAGSTPNDENAVQRAYMHWNHADHLCDARTSEFVRTDIVTTLKRAVNQRVRLISDLYNFRNVKKILRWNIGDLEALSRFGLVRPLMLDRLIKVRNSVEHEDSSPPSAVECRDLVEFVWYFIRSTDAVVREIRDSFELRPADAPHLIPDESPLDFSEEDYARWRANAWLPNGTWSHLDFSSETGMPYFYGNFPPEAISIERKDGWCSVHLTRDDESSVDGLRSIAGNIRGPNDFLTELWKRYFAASW